VQYVFEELKVSNKTWGKKTEKYISLYRDHCIFNIGLIQKKLTTFVMLKAVLQRELGLNEIASLHYIPCNDKCCA